jgi:cytochrome c556
MRKGFMLVTCGFVGMLGLTVLASDKPPADYANAMKAIAAAQDAATKAIQAEDFDAVEKHAASIVDAFPVIEKYWASKSDVAQVARTAAKAASDLRVSSQQRSMEGVAYSAKELTAACTNCHNAHRETMPDGTFQIK